MNVLIILRKTIPSHSYNLNRINIVSLKICFSSGYCIVYVSVLDANDNPPTFRQPRYDIQLNGSVLSDATVLRVEATDADAGNNGHISYYLRTNPFEYFQIDHDTGDITIQVKKKVKFCLQILCFTKKISVFKKKSNVWLINQ